jgi:hypothetical protein
MFDLFLLACGRRLVATFPTREAACWYSQTEFAGRAYEVLPHQESGL